jgi:hypothetical protein
MNKRHLAIPAIGLVMLGAGCLPSTKTVKVAQPFENPSVSQPININQGFGNLPKIAIPPSTAKVTVKATLPKLPQNITVLRLRHGLPDDTELKNLTNALQIPAGVLGNFPKTTAMSLEWRDDQGFRWSYRASERILEFWNTATSGPLTVAALRPYDELMATANAFIFSRGFRSQYYRPGVVNPDWYLWWTNGIAKHECLDAEAVRQIRGIAASDPLLAGGPPALVPDQGQCVKPEFPSRTVIRYHALLDERDIVRSDGSYVNGAEIVVDHSKGAIVSGKISLFSDPERSDYPSLDNEQALALLKRGGLSGAAGEIELTTLDFVFLRLEDASVVPPATYLIPSIMGKGTHIRPDGQTEAYRVVAPLLAQ